MPRPDSSPTPAIDPRFAAFRLLVKPSKIHRWGVYAGEEIPPREELTPQALGALQKAEIEKWWPIIKAAGIKVE